MAVGTQTGQCSQDARPEEVAIELPESMWKRIAAKAYALYEQRGRREGYALQDWLDAQYLVNQEIYDTH